MRCCKCNRETNEGDKCSYCEAEMTESVRILTPEEQSGYRGTTIDPEHDTDAARQKYYQENQQRRVYVKNISAGNSSWLMKIAIFAIIAAIAAFLLFIALPVALIGIGIGIVVWLVLSFMRG